MDQQKKANEWLKPSYEATAAVERTALHAAWEALSPIREGEEIAHNVATKCVLLAFYAVISVRRDADKEFEAANPGRKCHNHFIEAAHIVATALAFVDSIDQSVHPYSRSGMRLLSFSSACKALNAFADIEMAIEDDSSGFGSNGALDLLKFVGAA